VYWVSPWRVKVIVHHKRWCAARTIPPSRWWVNDWLAARVARLPGAEFDVRHKVAG
jgi:hypothetical protein